MVTVHDGWYTQARFMADGPFNRALCVQSHDMLYKTSRDILYTLRAGSAGSERL
jgi:hypothetical protein